ncbi:MAG: phosphatidylserine/phosphatidylglycerophosphate/cardiolipin synthase family protein [Gaiellales bacterium]|nr:MAG: phosphatidylserine/phosphatidylglycerophosphate/cardiolipin synthase family protein [Gaiellales bacterium]
MKTEVLVDSSEFLDRLSGDVRGATESVYLQAMTFEADSAGLRICEELRRSPARDIRVLVDEYIRVVMSDSCLLTPPGLLNRALRRESRETRALFDQLRDEGIQVRMTNPLGPMYTGLLARNHKKLVVIDGRVAYIGGINFSDHNFAWHDMMLRMEEEGIARYLEEDFISTWAGIDQKNLRSFPGFDFHQLDGRCNEESYEAIFSLMEEAVDSIIIESPYLSFPFYQKLREAVRRGVKVRLILPERNNKPLLQRYNLWEARRSGIDLRLLEGRMTHLKAMLIDGRKLIAGSSNFDYVSYRSLQELVVVITDRDTVRQFDERVFLPDWRDSVPAGGRRRGPGGGLCYAWLRLLDLVGLGLSKVATQAAPRS